MNPKKLTRVKVMALVALEITCAMGIGAVGTYLVMTRPDSGYTDTSPAISDEWPEPNLDDFDFPPGWGPATPQPEDVEILENPPAPEWKA